MLIIDGNSILNRCFYGIKLLSTKKGQYTNAIYGFLTTLEKLKQESQADNTIIAFDLKTPTFRKEIFDGYKAGRRGMPDELVSQVPVLKSLLGFLGYKIVSCEGYEADDIIGTLANIFRQSGHPCIIATGDRDLLQLVSDGVSVRIATTKAGQAQSVLYDENSVHENFGVSPRQLIEIKALQGDTSDNIPGVKGIGPKIAQSLIQEFGDIDNLYDNLESANIKENLKSKLKGGKESAYMSKKLGTICLHAPIDLNIEDYMQCLPNVPEAKRLMLDLEFYSLVDKLLPQGNSSSEKNKDDLNQGSKANFAITELSDKVSQNKLLAKLTLSESASTFMYKASNNKIDFVAIRFENIVYTIKNLDTYADEFINSFLESEKIKKIAYSIKEVQKIALKSGEQVNGLYFDISLAAYILNPSSSDYSIERLKDEYRLTENEYLPQKTAQYCEDEQCVIRNAVTLKKLEEIFYKELESNEQLDLIFKIENPLAEILAQMECCGFRVDKQGLLSYSATISEKIRKIENEIYKIIGFQFNLNSPKQLGAALFDELELPHGKKNKSGYSTNAKVLEKLRGYHPIIDMILEFRGLSKLKSTYCDSMAKLVESDGRIHPCFVQTETRTGRISCIEPNLQNIPIRTEMGRQLRKYFCAESGYLLIDADYSQIELRVLAHLSNDKNMIQAFKNEEDIHTLTASKIFNLPVNMINTEARVRAKAVNFGIIYGIGAFSLSQDLKITVKEANDYIKSYLAKYERVNDYLTRIVETAKEKGYCETMFHRRRYLPELSSSNFNLRSFGERVARNMPIQGSAADIIKIAMIGVSSELVKKNLNAKIILQVHDELIIECPVSEQTQVESILRQKMENAAKLSVPLTVNISSGETWYDCKN